ncbi:hypothetical protein TYRP_000213 [Tyrophagus putrescentiae]|nr:hypothetical protein TYRP_000213 [Tyrophagus putrescentiae]
MPLDQRYHCTGSLHYSRIIKSGSGILGKLPLPERLSLNHCSVSQSVSPSDDQPARVARPSTARFQTTWLPCNAH